MVASITANPQGQGLLLKSYFCGFFFFSHFLSRLHCSADLLKRFLFTRPGRKNQLISSIAGFWLGKKKWLKNVVLPFIVTMLGGDCAVIRLLFQLWRLRQEGLQLRPVWTIQRDCFKQMNKQTNNNKRRFFLFIFSLGPIIVTASKVLFLNPFLVDPRWRPCRSLS